MFSKEDYIKYFLQIRKIEDSMRSHFLAYSGSVDDPELKKFFFRLYKEEIAHSKVVTGMLETFGHKDETPGGAEEQKERG